MTPKLAHYYNVRNLSSCRLSLTPGSGVVGTIANSSDEITDPEVFDIFRSILKHADAVPGPYMSKLLDSIASGFSAQLDAAIRDSKEEDQQVAISHKTPLEMYAFLLNWFTSAADKVKSGGEDELAQVQPKARRGRGGKAGASRAAARKAEEWTWADQIPATLELFAKAMKLKTHRIWMTTPERDAFITCVLWSFKVGDADVNVKLLNPSCVSHR